MTGYDAGGSIQCTTLNSVARDTVNQSCWAYLGWLDSCNGCTTDPTKWGRADHDQCYVGAGSNCTCQTPTLGGQAVNLFGLNTDGTVGDDDKFHATLHCDALTATTSSSATACPSGQFVSGSTSGTLSCSTMDAAVTNYVRQSCNLYLGWHDACNGCTTVPTKWGAAGDSGCINSGGTNDTCTIDATGVLHIFGLNTDGTVDDDDTFYMGLHCAGATTTGGTATGSCPAGQFVTKVNRDGTVVCAGAASFVQTYVRSGCNLYFGWLDNCNGCTSAPSKWGKTNDTSCTNGAGTDDTCTTQTLGTQTVNLLGVNLDGVANDDDKFYTGLECN